MRSVESEEHLQQNAKRFFDYALPADAVAFHCPNGGYRDAVTAGKMKAAGALAGVPDWIILHQGKTFFLELKSKRGVLSEAQKTFRDKVTAQGFQYHVARSLLEVELALVAFGIRTSARVAA